jgi:hypothetical protein
VVQERVLVRLLWIFQQALSESMSARVSRALTNATAGLMRRVAAKALTEG